MGQAKNKENQAPNLTQRRMEAEVASLEAQTRLAHAQAYQLEAQGALLSLEYEQTRGRLVPAEVGEGEDQAPTIVRPGDE